MSVPSGRRVTHVNNDILYTWDNVPEVKYQNWLKMTPAQRGADFTVDGYPFFIQVETTNICNLKCPVCPAGGWGFTREKRHMKLGEFKSLIDDMGDYLLFIILWDWGEPLMNPELPEMVRCAAERDIKTVASTNCNAPLFFNETYMENLLSSGLSTLIFAIDSTCQESYELYRKKGDLARALEGIRKAVAIKKKLGTGPLLVMRTVLMRQNEHELAALRRLARDLGVDRFSAKTMNPLSLSETSDKDIIPQNTSYRRYKYKKNSYERLKKDFDCDVVWRQCAIHSNGNVIPCCWCYDDDYTAGNIFGEGGLTRLWNSRAYRDLRKKISSEKDSVPYCKTCSFNYEFSQTGWFLQTIDLNQSIIKQYTYLLKRYAELHMSPALLNNLLKVRNMMRRCLQKE